MPAIRSAYLTLSSDAQFTAERAVSTRIFNPHHHTRSRRLVSDPYPSAEEVFLRSNMLEPDPEEHFGDLFLADLILANKRVGRRCLVRYKDNFQEDLLGLMDRGLQMDMDVDEPGRGREISYSIGYAVSMGMGLLGEINALRECVSISLIYQLRQWADDS